MWPYMFDQVLEEYDRRYGVDQAHLTRIAEVNLRNAKRNPNAQTRGWTVPELGPGGDPAANPPGRGPDQALRLQPGHRRRRGRRARLR